MRQMTSYAAANSDLVAHHSFNVTFTRRCRCLRGENSQLQIEAQRLASEAAEASEEDGLPMVCPLGVITFD